ncbi:MAG: SCO family protein [Magnetovibrio sp.]|nr:SCO family protein [Magnetovibrio sp.]
MMGQDTSIHRAFLFFASALLLAALAMPFQAYAKPTVSNASDSNLNEEKALELSQAAIGRQVGDYTFRDTAGKHVKLSDFLGKPVVISLIYSSCADVCPVITSTLIDVDEIARKAVGDDAYTILTIGFDTGEDNPVRMKSFAKNQGVDISDHWKFLSGDIASIAGLSDDLGFQFFESTKGFDHLTQTSILDRHGKVYRQIYGETFVAPHLVEPLKNLTFGTETPFASLGDLINKVRLFCTIYDPTADRYRFEYSIFFRMFVGGTIILGMMVFLLNWVREDRKRKKQLSKIESETI